MQYLLVCMYIQKFFCGNLLELEWLEAFSILFTLVGEYWFKSIPHSAERSLIPIVAGSHCVWQTAQD